MLDIAIANAVLSKMKKSETSDKKTTEGFESNSFWSVLLSPFTIIWLLIGGWAAHLSWKANTLVGWDLIPKIIFSIFAFLLGVSYLITYFIYKMDLVNYISASKSV